MSLYEISAFSLKYNGPIRNLNLITSGYLKYEEKEVYSSTAKFDYEEARSGLGRGVHFRCIHNNKYLVRHGNTDWITATADEPVEDPTRQDCTLFQLDIKTNTSMSWIHVNTKKTVAMALPTDLVYGYYLTISSNNVTSVECSPIDVERIIKLPKTVVFKADNDKYLMMQGVSQLFIGEDRHQIEAWYETFPVNNGDVRFRSVHNGQFWKPDINGFIVAGSNNPSSDSDTVFQIVRLGDYTIGLINRGNDKFCRRIAGIGNSNQFKADVSSGVKEAAFVIEEPIIERSIQVEYRLEDARIYDEKPRSWLSQVAFNSAKSRDLETTLSIKYTETMSFSYNTTRTASTNVTSTTRVVARVPLVAKASQTLVISAGIEVETALSEKQDKSESYEFSCTVLVPPGEKRVARVLALEAKCDVPFSYVQTDYLANGEIIKTNLQDGVFKGLNGYEFHAQVYDPDEPTHLMYDEPVATRTLPNTFSREMIRSKKN